MRRQPIFFIIDVSGSLDTNTSSTFIEQSIKAMKNDPRLLETVCLTLVTFSHDVKIETEYTELYEISSIRFGMRPCLIITQDSINNVFTALKEIYLKNTQKTTLEKKGDNYPIIIWLSNLSNCIDKDNPLLLEYQLLFKASVGFYTFHKEGVMLDAVTLKHWEIDKSKQLFVKSRNLNLMVDDEIHQTERSVHFLRRGYELVYNTERL